MTLMLAGQSVRSQIFLNGGLPAHRRGGAARRFRLNTPVAARVRGTDFVVGAIEGQRALRLTKVRL